MALSTVRERLNAKGAHELAQTIRAYWAEQGYPPPRVWVEEVIPANLPAEIRSAGAFHVVKSDMLGGMPRGERVHAVAQSR